MAFAWRVCGTITRLRNVSKHSRRFLCVTSFRSGRIVPFKLSDIGEGIRDVTVKEWFVKPGDKVSQFDNICEVQSDKASVTITSRYDGSIKKLYYKIDEVALVGDPLVDIELDGDESVEPTTGTQDSKETITDVNTNKSLETKNIETHSSSKNISSKALATPAVRRIAIENNINLKDVLATGRDGRVLKEDILAYLEQKSDSSLERKIENKESVRGQSVPVKAYSKHMWKTMTDSLRIPHFVYSDECTLNKLVRYREEVKDTMKEQGISLTLMPFFIKAASKALEKLPELNAWIDEENQTIRVLNYHNISVAMDTPEGLVVPNVKNVQNLSIVAIAKELNRLQELGRRASLSLADISNGTFSLSNIGVVGGTYTKPVILPPQIVIGALGKVQKLPRFDHEENVIAANVLSVSWAADHRVVDGVTMAKFSNIWKHYVENPVHLLLGA